MIRLSLTKHKDPDFDNRVKATELLLTIIFPSKYKKFSTLSVQYINENKTCHLRRNFLSHINYGKKFKVYDAYFNQALHADYHEQEIHDI